MTQVVRGKWQGAGGKGQVAGGKGIKEIKGRIDIFRDSIIDASDDGSGMATIGSEV